MALSKESDLAQMSKESLVARVNKLEGEVESLREDCSAAGELGMQLIQSNTELREQIERDALVYQEEIATLKQENHVLSNKLLMHASNRQAYQDELDHIRSSLETAHSQQINRIEQSHALQLAEHQKHAEDMTHEAERLEVLLKKERDIVKVQEETIQRLKDEAACHLNTSLLHNEMSELEQECLSLRQEVEEVRTHLLHANNELDYARSEGVALRAKVSELEEQVEERGRMANDCLRSLKEAQDEVAVLRGQIECDRMKKLQDGWQDEGNSLFAEVEDRRLEVERKLIGLQVKHDTLEKTHSVLRQQYRKLKAEISALLCRHSTLSADAAHVERLQRTLRQRDHEVQDLMAKIQRLEKQKEMAGEVCMYSGWEQGGGKNVPHMKQQIEDLEKELSDARRELELKTTQLIWEENRLSEAEAKLHKCEQEKARLVNQVCKMHIKFQEVRDKEQEVRNQLSAAENEVSTLKQQLKGTLGKPCSNKHTTTQQTTTSSTDITTATNATCTTASDTMDKASAVKTVVQKPIDLLEELEKANKITRQKPLHTTDTPPNENKQSTTDEVSITTSAKDSNGKASGDSAANTENDATIAQDVHRKPVKVVKTISASGQRVNECSQQ